MSVLANIIKGVQKRLTGNKERSRFATLSRFRRVILKNEGDTSVKSIVLNGQTIRYKRPYELFHTYKELLQDEIYLFKAATDTPVILDCGANIGISVLYFKALYPKAQVTAFEPDPANFLLLQENIKYNNIQSVKLVQAAVWKEETTLNFAGFGGQGSRIDDGSFDNLPATKVPAVRLAELLQKQEIDFLKIDIEGAEYDVIRDCAPYLHSVKNMFLEYHGKAEETGKLAEMLHILAENGFKTYIKMAADLLKTPFMEHHTGHSFDVQLNIFCYR